MGEICRRLDGIPLAIELAAARLKALSVQEIAARLDDRFRLLTGGSRTAPPRQQTLRATMDWSYELLTRPERLLLQRLAVFAGSFSLEAAEAICGECGVGCSGRIGLRTVGTGRPNTEHRTPRCDGVGSPDPVGGSIVGDRRARPTAVGLSEACCSGDSPVFVETGRVRIACWRPCAQYALERLRSEAGTARR